jgi:hypothetical protein
MDCLLTFKAFVRSLSALSDVEYKALMDSHYYKDLVLLLTEPNGMRFC